MYVAIIMKDPVSHPSISFFSLNSRIFNFVQNFRCVQNEPGYNWYAILTSASCRQISIFFSRCVNSDVDGEIYLPLPYTYICLPLQAHSHALLNHLPIMTDAAKPGPTEVPTPHVWKPMERSLLMTVGIESRYAKV